MGLATRRKWEKRRSRFVSIFHREGKDATWEYLTRFKEKHHRKIIPDMSEAK